MEHVVGIGGFAVSANAADIIKTFALSTCVGIVFYNTRKNAMGMAHIQLPNSRAAHAEDKPSRFADVAPAFMLGQMSKLGLTKNEMNVSLYGGIDGRGEKDCFRVGEKNREIVKQALRALGLVYTEVDMGGCDSRTLVAYVGTGVVEVIKRPMALGGISVNPAPRPRASAAAPGLSGARPASRLVSQPSALATAGNPFGRSAQPVERKPMGITLKNPGTTTTTASGSYGTFRR
ncbi:hypothetical protein FACS1894208_04670 [Clostridia bacterium]|nr:hypothetical protein FACS1894208_04670 [Clostridia bacterium]